MAENTKHVSYADAGVDTAEGARAVDAIKAAVATTNRPEVIGGLGGFGSCFSAAALKGMEDPILVSGTDGVGTKLAIAQLLDRHETVGEDLVAMCVDDIVPMGAEPLFFLDYVAIGKLRSEHVAKIVGGIAEGCRKSGCALVGGEMAEHPGVMAADDYDLAGFVVGVVDRPQAAGGRSSCARVTSFSACRAPASTPTATPSCARSRSRGVRSRSSRRRLRSWGGESLADAVMRPTKIYAGQLLAALRAGAPVHAMAHITGGGITENLDRAMPDGLDALVYRGGEDGPAWDVPPVISYMIREAGLTTEEAYRTFNMGRGHERDLRAPRTRSACGRFSPSRGSRAL